MSDSATNETTPTLLKEVTKSMGSVQSKKDPIASHGAFCWCWCPLELMLLSSPTTAAGAVWRWMGKHLASFCVCAKGIWPSKAKTAGV